jgi:hypothetical protein
LSITKGRQKMNRIKAIVSSYDELENRKTSEIELLEKELNERNYTLREGKNKSIIIERGFDGRVIIYVFVYV